MAQLILIRNEYDSIKHALKDGAVYEGMTFDFDYCHTGLVMAYDAIQTMASCLGLDYDHVTAYVAHNGKQESLTDVLNCFDVLFDADLNDVFQQLEHNKNANTDLINQLAKILKPRHTFKFEEVTLKAMYLDYLNDFITLQGFTDYYNAHNVNALTELSTGFYESCINRGRTLVNGAMYGYTISNTARSNTQLLKEFSA